MYGYVVRKFPLDRISIGELKTWFALFEDDEIEREVHRVFRSCRSRRYDDSK